MEILLVIRDGPIPRWARVALFHSGTPRYEGPAYRGHLTQGDHTAMEFRLEPVREGLVTKLELEIRVGPMRPETGEVIMRARLAKVP